MFKLEELLRVNFLASVDGSCDSTKLRASHKQCVELNCLLLAENSIMRSSAISNSQVVQAEQNE